MVPAAVQVSSPVASLSCTVRKGFSNWKKTKARSYFLHSSRLTSFWSLQTCATDVQYLFCGRVKKYKSTYMKNVQVIQTKIMSVEQAQHILAGARITGKTVAFTNGCFDILHEGHIFSLSQAAREADMLVVGVNSDASVKKLKGDNRPINNEHSRSLILASLMIVDIVVIFNEDTPLELITALSPDVLIKGGDYTIEQIAGAKEVIANGGKVIINPIIEGFSTTGIIGKIRTL